MLNEFKICPRCGCNSAYVTGVGGISFDDLVVVDFVCSNCGHAFRDQVLPVKESRQKEKLAMQVSYNGFTGRMEKLERKITAFGCGYDISIYDSEKQVTHSFTNVKLEDVKFLGGAVSFSG